MSQKKKYEAEAVYQDAMDHLDEVHGKLVDLAARAGVKFDPLELKTTEGDELPASQFVVEGDEPPERGGIAFDTRLGLCLTREQAEVLLAELARSLREEENEIELEIDGRMLIKRSDARDVLEGLERA